MGDADALRHRLHRAVHDRRADGTVPRRASASTCTSPTPTSSSRTSTTSWSAARSWATSAACTTGGRRSAGGCTTRCWRKISAAIIFIGFNLTFFPQFILGYLGMPRRYHAYPPEFQVLNVLSSAGASILGVGYLLPMIYLMWSLRYGRVAGSNPWGAVGLEWTTTSPPPTENFAETPDRDLGRVRVSDAGGGSRCLSLARTASRRSRTSSSDLEQQTRGVDARHVGVPRHRGAVLRRPLPGLLRSTAAGIPRRSPRRATSSTRAGRHDQHRRAHHQQPDDGAGGPRRADRPAHAR